MPGRALQALTCWRCGFQWQRPEVAGNQPRWCDDCRPLVVRDMRARSRSRHPEVGRKHTTRTIERRRIRRAGYQHVLDGITPEQWVARWRERPDLFLALVVALERSVVKFPEIPEEYREAA